MSKVTLELEIDARQKRLALIREEDRQLVKELSELWKEHSAITSGAMDAKDVSPKS